MVGNIVFHLGDCKTGSTSIQHVLAHKAWKAAGVSLLYPTRLHHNPLALTLNKPEAGRFRAERFGQLHERLSASGDDYAVVSAEHFEFVDPVILREAIETYLPEFAGRIRLIAYVRPHADRLISSYVERRKLGEFYGSVTALHRKFKRKGRLFYTPRFEKWRKVFGPSFTLRPMIRSQLHKQDVVEDFFHHVFEGRPFQITDGTEANSSLPLESLIVAGEVQKRIRQANRNLAAPQKLFGLRFAPILAKHGGSNGTKPRLHKALAEDVVRVYRKDAAALDAAFFDGTPMSAALDGAVAKAVNEPQSFQAADHCSPRELQHVHAFADLLLRLMEEDPEAFLRAMRPPELRRDRDIPSENT